MTKIWDCFVLSEKRFIETLTGQQHYSLCSFIAFPNGFTSLQILSHSPVLLSLF